MPRPYKQFTRMTEEKRRADGGNAQPTVFSQVGRNDWRAADFVVESMC
jgi:hypothetical protein